MELTALVALSLALTAGVTPACMVLARRTGVLDRPGPLKPHSSPTPYLGGLAVLTGTVVGVLASDRPAVLVPLVAVLLLGLVDDVRDLAVAPRLLGEAATGVVGAMAIGASTWPAVLGIAALVVVLVNAVNLVDGVDALAAAVCACSLAAAAMLTTEHRELMACAAAACVGFLFFNRPPARIYLGDAGSYLLGTLVALGVAGPLVDGSARGSAGAAWLALAGLAAYPLVEIASTLIRRIMSGSPMSQGDREHLYDRGIARGAAASRVVVVLTLLHAAFVLTASVAFSRKDAGTSVGIAAMLGLLTGAAVFYPRRPPSSKAVPAA